MFISCLSFLIQTLPSDPKEEIKHYIFQNICYQKNFKYGFSKDYEEKISYFFYVKIIIEFSPPPIFLNEN